MTWRRAYILRRYFPPTWNSASVIWPSEQQRTASISCNAAVTTQALRSLFASRPEAPAGAYAYGPTLKMIRLAIARPMPQATKPMS